MKKYYQDMSPSKVETWLPIFPGFYGTIFEFNEEDYEIDYYESQREKDGHKKHPDCYDYQFNYKQYNEEYCDSLTTAIETELIGLGFVSAIKMQRITSPKYYNFGNDAVDIEVNLSKENKEKIMQFLYDNQEGWINDIKALYSSCDGFISHYSNSGNEWLEDADLLVDDHKLGRVLEFILEMNSYNQESLYDDAEAPPMELENYGEIMEWEPEPDEEDIFNVKYEGFPFSKFSNVPKIQMFEDYGQNEKQLELT